MLVWNRVGRMGRKKTGYRAPEGLIKRKGSPYWWIRIRWKGKDINKSTRVPLENITRATIILREVQKGLLERDERAREILGQSVPFRELAERYLKEVSPGKRSGRSDKTNSICPIKYFGERRIDMIKKIDIYKYMEWRKVQISERKKRPVSGSTINREVSFIGACMKKAVPWGYIERSPVEEIERQKEKKRKRYITDREFDGIKAEARKIEKAKHLPDMVDFLYYTGLREGRMLTLRWSQVNFEDRFMTFEEGMGNKEVPERVWINDRLYSLLMKLKRERGLQKVVGPYVFQKRDGTRFKSVRKAWATACSRAKVENAKIHDIRHKTASDLGDLGFTPTQIAIVLAHSSTATTDRYTHLQAIKIMLESLGNRGIKTTHE